MNVSGATCVDSTSTTTTVTYSTTPSAIATTYPLWIFGTNSAGSISNGSYTGCKIYYIKIYENDVLTHNMLPYNGGTNIGFVDTIAKKAYLVQSGFTGVTK